MSLETLLEAAKYVEYRSEAKARGEEPHDYYTFSKLCSASKDGVFKVVESVSQKRQPTLSNSSHSSEEIKEKRRPINQMTRDSIVPHEHTGSGTREVHNKLEKNRRAHLKECFEALKRQLPNMDDRKTSNLSILRGAIRFIQVLKRKEREYEHDMERLAREKIAFQQRLSILKKDLSSQLDHIDSNTFIPDDDNETTTTASECGALSDFDDNIPQENSALNSSDFTSSSSSSTVSGILVGPAPSTVASTSSIVLSKQSSSSTQISASAREPQPISHHYSHESLLTVSNKAPMASSMPTAHQISNTEGNTAQTARVFSTGNIHAMAGIFASPHTMQVITQPSGIKVITAPNSLMASNTNVQHIAVSHHQHGQIHVLAPSSNASYTSSISAASSKSFNADSLVQVASSNTKSISKPHLVSPLALVTPQTMVGLSHNSAGKSHPSNAAVPDLVPPPSSPSLNLTQKGNSVISGNMAMAVKSGLPPNSVVVSGASHSNMIATLQMSKSHPQVIQPTLTSSIIAQGGSQINNGSHHGVSSGLKPIASTPVRSLPHIAGVTHVVVSQSPITTPVGQIVTPGSHVSAVTPLVGSVSVVSHPGAVHQQSIGKVIASPVLKPVNQINQIPIIQQQFLQQVSVGSTSQPIVKPVVVMSMPNMVPSSSMSSLTPTSLVQMSEPPGAVRGSSSQK